MMDLHRTGYCRGVAVGLAALCSLSLPVRADTPTAQDLIQSWRSKVGALGAYHLRVHKRERIDGKLQPWQTKPLAVRLEFVEGSAKGRKALYNEQVRKDDVRVREAGLLGVVGAVWVNVNGPLSRGDTRHPVTQVGLISTIEILAKDVAAAAAFGGVNLSPEAEGCWKFEAPAQAHGLYATRSRICVDPKTGLPSHVTASDAAGLFEEYEFTDVQANAATDAFFTPEAAGL
jgi:hypothetical protein